MHVDNRFLLKMDFEDFFPSIQPDDLNTLLAKQNIDIDDEDFKTLARVCFWHKDKDSPLSLCIGAPASPLIANCVMNEFDRYISGICSQRSVTYSRYADDLTFSTNEANVLNEIESIVRKTTVELESPSLSINEKKTVHSSKKHLRMVTGLVLTPESTLSIGRERKRIMRSMVHHAIKGELDERQLNKLRGLIAFAYDVEPGFVDRLINKYGARFLYLTKFWSDAD